MPSDHAIRRVMAETGMGFIQARNHLKAREELRFRRVPMPVRPAGGEYDLAASHLASLSPERRAELERTWND